MTARKGNINQTRLEHVFWHRKLRGLRIYRFAKIRYRRNINLNIVLLYEMIFCFIFLFPQTLKNASK